MTGKASRPLALALLLLASAPARAGAGRAALPFLTLDSGPREVAMGGAATALGGDAYGMLYNPALLASLYAREFAFSDAEWFSGIRYQDLLYAHPLRTGAVGAGLKLVGYGDIAGYDATGARTGGVSASDVSAGLAYARRVPDTALSLGAGFKVARESLAGVSAQALLADLGAAWTPREATWAGEPTLGLALKNLGGSVKYDAEGAPAPTELAAGVASRFMAEALTLSLDARFPRSSAPRGELGAEYWAHRQVALRAGFEMLQDQGPGLRAGFGFRLDRFSVDYAFMPMGDSGFTHHVGLRFSFGGPAEDAYRQGLSLMRDGKPAEAILKFDEALNLDPRHPRAGARLRDAYERIRKAQSLENAQ